MVLQEVLGKVLKVFKNLKVAEYSAHGSFFLLSGTALATVIMIIASILIARLFPDFKKKILDL